MALYARDHNVPLRRETFWTFLEGLDEKKEKTVHLVL